MQYGILPFPCNVLFMNPFFVTDSILCLVDSCASAIQLNLVFASDALAFSFFETTVSRISILWRVQVSVPRLPILVFLSSERLFQFLSKRQAICDLDVMSFRLVLVSHRTTYILLEKFRSMM